MKLFLDLYHALSPAYYDNALHIRALEPPTIELMLFLLLLLTSQPPISLSYKPSVMDSVNSGPVMCQ
jgi:hypothetical protein